MFALRRIAVRAIQFQPARQLSTLRPVSSNLPLQKPALYRSFHNCRRWLAEDDLNKESPAEAQGGETVTAEPETQAGIKEESVAASDVIDAKSSTTSSSAAETAKDALSSAAETVQNAASSAAATAQSHFSSSNGLRSQSPPSKILYVGNLFFEVTSANLEAEFARYGEVTNSRVVSDNRGMSKGFGYIEFASQESADKAVRELDQKVFQGRRMAVQYHVRRDPRRTREHNNKSIPPSKTLFIGNMSYQMSDRDLNGRLTR